LPGLRVGTICAQLVLLRLGVPVPRLFRDAAGVAASSLKVVGSFIADRLGYDAMAGASRQFITNRTSHAKQGPGQEARRRAGHSRQAGEGEEEGGGGLGDSEGREEEERSGGGSAEAGRAEGQAEMKAEQVRSPILTGYV
jgi:hypothetical protein